MIKLIKQKIKNYEIKKTANIIERNHNYVPHNVLTSSSIIKIIIRMLYNVNAKLTLHSECTAYIAMRIIKERKLNSKISKQNVLLLSLFHTIGFYKFLPNDTSFDFFSDANFDKYLYATHYLKNMTPLKNEAEALTYYKQSGNSNSVMEEIASIVFLAARISNYIHEHPYTALPEDLELLAPGKLNLKYIYYFENINVNGIIEKTIITKEFIPELRNEIDKIRYSEEDTLQLLKFLVFVQDFKSTSALTHSINVACFSIVLGQRTGIVNSEIDRLYVSALLHDIGKIVIPYYILESPKKLDTNMMMVVREHVSYTYKMLEGLVPEDIAITAYRHHEKLNGTGYPEMIFGNLLTLQQRILTVADIITGLTDARTYKTEFSKDKTLTILKEMASAGEIDKKIVSILEDSYEEILNEVKRRRDAFFSDFARIEMDFQTSLENARNR